MKSGVRERGEREDDVCQKTSEIGRRVFFERDSEGVFGMRSFCPSLSRAITSANFSWSLLSFPALPPSPIFSDSATRMRSESFVGGDEIHLLQRVGRRLEV
jgi:hypothetical protein